MYKLGFTGTQKGMHPAQMRAFEIFVRTLVQERDEVEFHHGDCVGADSEAAAIAKAYGCRVVGHPPTDSSKRAFFPSDEELEPKPYLERNQDIVDICDLLFGTPFTSDWPTNFRGQGTWSTLNRARKAAKSYLIISPRGIPMR
jgi:hypothetical protein